MTETTIKCSIGIDVGGTNLRLALVTNDGRILKRGRLKTEIDLGRNVFLDRVVREISLMRSFADSTGLDLTAIGVGVPGLVSNNGFIHSSVNLLPLEGLNLRDALTQLTGLRTVVVNDANASAWGERVYGAGKPYRSFIMATIGTGVGGGLVLNGSLWTGIDGVAGEFGHVTVEPDGKPCPCGNRGCLEQYASATAIVSAASQHIVDDIDVYIPEYPSNDLTAEKLSYLARSGINSAMKVFADAGRYLGIASASLANLLNLEAVIIGGGVAASFDLLVDSIQREIEGRTFHVPGERIKVVKGILGDDAGLLGSSALAVENI